MKKTICLICGLLFSFKANAQSAENLQKIENYLNSMKSIEATFVQMASNGSTAEGRLFIKKPNKIRMEYAEPTNVLIVGNGENIVYNDLDLDQVTHIDYDDIPASMILSDKIKIDGEKIKIIDFYQDTGSTSITLDYAEKGDVGPITLVFSNNPMELKQWKIVDPQSVEVSISLYDAKKDGDINDEVFKFKNKKTSSRNFKKKK
ncbi:MAG: outer membrane lipoprotein carrier protein LolA [Alphaproteobacteria bacterium]|nr:outer membrane lipoprotein carrier protein LolA [Alphaproteobacteria bacterium]